MSNIIPNAESFVSGTGRTNLIIIHGLGGTPDDYRGFAGELINQKIKVICPRLTGHGIDLPALAAADVDDWLTDIDQTVKSVPAGSPIVLMGVSFGGALALGYAADHPEINGLILLNPALNYKIGGLFQDLGLKIWRLFSSYFPKPGLSVEDKLSYARSGSMTAWPIRTIIETKRFIKHRVLTNLSKVRQPVMLIYNPDDPYIGHGQVDKFLNLLSSINKNSYSLPGHTHRPIKDQRYRPLIVNKTVDFIFDQLLIKPYNVKIDKQN
jgi:carboxylesterase